jgi:primosomal protein N'
MAPLYMCAECQVEMRCKTNEVYVIEKATFGPCNVWSADLWQCPQCGHKTIAGFGLEPLAEHYQDRFEGILAKARDSGQYYVYQHEVKLKKEAIEREVKSVEPDLS